MAPPPLALVVAALLFCSFSVWPSAAGCGCPGRGRQLRLGIVDAFDLDRQRQLVIVRRDNAEHLIMIGGPNDILIESQIIRAEAREGRQREKERDRDHRDKDFAEPVQLPPAQTLKPAAAEPQLPPFVPEAPPAPVAPPPVVQPVARTPLPPITPRRTAPRPELKPAAPVPPVEKLPEPPAPPAPEPVAAPSAEVAIAARR